MDACLRQDRRAQEVFYRRFAPAGLRVCRRYVRGRAEAMELLNVGMLKVFANLDSYAWEGSLEGWIKRVIFNSSMDQLRKRKPEATLEITEWDQPAEAEVNQQLYTEDLHHVIDLLPEPSREVFRLFAVEGFEHAEIAERLGFSVGNSRWHLNKARNILRKKLASPGLKINRHAG